MAPLSHNLDDEQPVCISVTGNTLTVYPGPVPISIQESIAPTGSCPAKESSTRSHLRRVLTSSRRNKIFLSRRGMCFQTRSSTRATSVSALNTPSPSLFPVESRLPSIPMLKSKARSPGPNREPASTSRFTHSGGHG